MIAECRKSSASCQQFSICDSELLMGPRHSLWIQSFFFLRTQVWWSSPNQNWSSKLCPWIHECHFGLKKMSNTPQMRQILWQTRRVALFFVPFAVHCIYIKLQTTWIFTGLPTTPTLSPWTDSSKPYCLKQKRFSSSFCPGTMRSDLWSVRCFGTVGKHHHVPWTADFFWVIRGEDLMEVLGMALKFGDSFRKCRPQVAQLTHVPRSCLPEIDARNGKTYMTGIGHGVLIGVRGNCATISDLDCITI